MSDQFHGFADGPSLAFLIDAPMQSWGKDSRFQWRETGGFPTKSGIVGLVAAAAGIDKHGADEENEIAKLAELTLTVAAIPRIRRRIERTVDVTRIHDFHTIGGGYDRTASDWEKACIPRKASGPPFGTVITHRSYLTDARFIAILTGDSTQLERCQKALKEPVWGIWFGRKHCVPALPLSPEIGGDREGAFQKVLKLLSCYTGEEWMDRPLADFDFQVETNAPDAAFFQSDQPVSFGKHHGAVPRPYRARGIFQNWRRPSSD